MNRSLLAVGLVGLVIAGLWYGAGGPDPLPVARAADDSPRVAAPYKHENLAVYFVYGTDSMPDAKVLTLQEALERNLAVVHETSDVNMLAVENLSPEYELFVQSGDIVKGGKQDRMVQSDMLLPPKSGVVPMPANCVEQGRWTNRGSEDSKKFASSEKFASGKELKYANATGQQSAVWQNVSMNQDKLNANLSTTVNADASPTSFQLTLESPVVKEKVAAYEAALKAHGESREGIVGVVFVVNGQVTGAEVYGSNVLFRKAWPKLLNSAAVEALAECDKPAVSLPSTRELERYLVYGATADLPDSPESDSTVVAKTLGRSGRTRSNDRELFFEAIQNAPVGQPGSGAVLQQAGGGFANPPARPGTITPAPVQAVAGLPEAQPALANLGGNRLNTNSAENRSTLMVESRDPGRANTVIHRSYIKK